MPSDQSKFNQVGSGANQATLILGRLAATPGEWVAMPELATVSGAYAVHSRISDLRRAGYQIQHRNIFPKRGERERTVKSFYRLITG